MQAGTRHVSVIMTTVPRLSVATDETSCRLPDTGHVRALRGVGVGGEDQHRGPSLEPGGGRFPLMHTCKFVGCECVVVGLVPLGPN
jgi:hypothetical protein